MIKYIEIEIHVLKKIATLTPFFPVMPYGVIDFRILQESRKSLSLGEFISFVLL